MALKKTGVQLVAEGAPEYLAAMAGAGRATLALGDASSTAARQAAAYAQRIDHLNTTIGLQKRQLALLESQLAQTAAAHGADSVQAQKQQLAVDRLSASILNNQRTVNRLESELQQLGRAEDTAAQKTSKLGEVMTGALRRAGEMTINLMADVARAIVSGIGDAISMTGDYEQAMNVLQVQSGATAEQMQRVAETAKALGADLTLPGVSAATAGQAMLELSKGGLSVEQSMAAAKGTLQLAAAAETDVATAANITTGALAAFNLEGDKAGYIADVLANAANQSRASIVDMAQGFQQGAFAFHAAGQGADDLAAALVILTQNGLTGSDAGTALKNAMMRLFKPTKEAAGVMREMGFSAYDAQGNMLPFRDIIGGLNKGLAGLTQAERNAALGTIFLSDGMKAMIPLLEEGVDGFDKTRAAVNRQGSAAELAAAQMKGLKGAAQGLTSQIETLALEALEPLLPIMTAAIQKAAEFAGTFVGKVGPAMLSVIAGAGEVAGVLLSIGDTITANAVPALVALGVASLAYAVTQLPVMIASITAATVAFGAQALAIATAAAPFVLIAGVLFAVTKAYQAFYEKVTAATDAVLAGKQFWTESAAALDRFGQSSAETQTKLQPLVDSINEQRNALHANIESLGARMAAGDVSEAQYIEEMAAINAQSAAIGFATEGLNGLLQADLQHVAASMTATAQNQVQTDSQNILTGAIQLTEEELKALAKTMEEAYQQGTAAIESYVNAAIGFEAALTAAIKEGNAEQAADVAHNYAEQAAAARASIGEQLSAYTLAQMQLGNISREQAGIILGQIEQTFGTTQNIAASTFLKMEEAIDQAAANGGESLSNLGSDLDRVAEDAISTKQEMDALATKYEAELVENFKSGKINADQLRKALDDIPSKVYSEVHIHTRRTESTETGESGGRHGGEREARARGGPVAVGRSYTVGENGPEIFTPSVNGTIVPPATAGQIMAGGSTTITNTKSSTYNYSPTYGAAPRAPSADFATMTAWGS